MELCTPQTISNVFQIKCFNPNPHFLHSRPSLLPERFTFFRRNSGLLRPVTPLLRATTSEEKNTIIDEQQERPSGVITIDKSPSDEQNGAFETKLAEVAEEETPTGEQMLNFEFLEALNVKLDSEDTYPLLIYGSGALVTVWLAAAVIGAIDSVPVVCSIFLSWRAFLSTYFNFVPFCFNRFLRYWNLWVLDIRSGSAHATLYSRKIGKSCLRKLKR